MFLQSRRLQQAVSPCRVQHSTRGWYHAPPPPPPRCHAAAGARVQCNRLDGRHGLSRGYPSQGFRGFSGGGRLGYAR
eukprot:scaffold42576_cov54-Phaeocystis_antarctica.AAC.5